MNAGKVPDALKLKFAAIKTFHKFHKAQLLAEKSCPESPLISRTGCNWC
ncbi:MAG: hypothetical protein KO318_11295 [Methanobacterium sp.]|nr:hypothetical protein [Methanobacterium sp.]